MKDKINILFVIPTLTIGGAEIQLYNLVKGLDKNKYKITVCCTTMGGAFVDRFEKIGIRPIILRKKHKLGFLVLIRLIEIIRKQKIDIIHTWLFTANVWGRLAAKVCGVRIIISSERNVTFWKSGVYRFIEKVLAPFSSVILANSQGVRDSLITFDRIPASKVKVIHNGLDLSRFDCMSNYDDSAIRNEYGIDSHCIVIGNVCRIHPQKDLDTFTEMASLLIERYKNLSFLIIGGAYLGQERPYMEHIVRRINALELSDKVTITGFVEDVPEFLSRVDIFVQTSTREGLSNALMEAMAMGKAVVATAVGGTPELIDDGINGYLVSPKDVNAISDRVGILIENLHIRSRFGDAAKITIQEKFSLETMVDNMQRLYEELYEKNK